MTAVATLVLAQVATRGGTPLPVDPLLKVAERALSTFPTTERGAVLEEVVAVLDWLATTFDRAGTTGGRERDRVDGRDVHHDPDPWIDRISDALDDVHDLDIEYFSFHRGEWSSRRVTPKKVDGEWLVAHCHMRDDERRFRLTRIRTMEPA